MPRAAVNGIHLYYEEVNAAPYWLPARPPVIFVHGLSSDHTIWAKQVLAFAQDRPVITVDVRGHGRSDKPEGNVYEITDHTADLLGLVHHLGYSKVHIVGVSMGGMIAQQMALREPERLQSISLVCSSCEPPREGATLEWRLEMFDKSPTLEGYYAPVFQRALAAHVAQEHRDYLYQLAIHNPRALQRAGMIATFSYRARDAMGAIRVPTLVVGGAHDGSIPPRLSEELAAAIPNAKLMILPDSGHCPYVEAPESLNRALKSFIEGVEH
ncbi:MAG: alpha/beta fold hydrolase [Burkholderiales bacterium]